MKLDLKKDRRTVRKYLQSRIADYSANDNIGPGSDDAPIRLITLGYYAEQGGYVNLVFDTRPKAEVDGEWTIYIDNDVNTCPFPDWNAACESICGGQSISVIRHDGANTELGRMDDDEVIQSVFGDMLVDVLLELRDDGSLAQLPLSPQAFMVVEEFDGRFFWPTYKTRKTAGRINTR